MVPDRKARLLLESSQASPPSSWASFQNPTIYFTDSMVSLRLRTTVLPSASTSLPPNDPRIGKVRRVAESVAKRLADGPALGFQFLPASRYAHDRSTAPL